MPRTAMVTWRGSKDCAHMSTHMSTHHVYTHFYTHVYAHVYTHMSTHMSTHTPQDLLFRSDLSRFWRQLLAVYRPPLPINLHITVHGHACRRMCWHMCGHVNMHVYRHAGMCGRYLADTMLQMLNQSPHFLRLGILSDRLYALAPCGMGTCHRLYTVRTVPIQ